MPQLDTDIWLQWMVVASGSVERRGNIIDIMPIQDAAGNYQFISEASSSGVGPAASLSTPEIRVLRKTFRSVPVLWKEELRQDYKELGNALAEMTEVGEADELKIDNAVYKSACNVAFSLMTHSYAAPTIFTHGPKSVVFEWSTGPNSLYLTISADKLSALISTPERIKRRMEYSLQALRNPSLIFSAIQSAYLEQPIRLIHKSASNPAEIENSPEEAVG